jgi:hypothetical protein
MRADERKKLFTSKPDISPAWALRPELRATVKVSGLRSVRDYERKDPNPKSITNPNPRP